MRSVLPVTAVLCLLFATPSWGRSPKTYFQFGFGPSFPTGLTGHHRNLGGHFEDEVSFVVSENFRLGFENRFTFLGVNRHAYPGYNVMGGGQWSFFFGVTGRAEITCETGTHAGAFASTGVVRIMQNARTMSYLNSYGAPVGWTELGYTSTTWYYSFGATFGYKLLFVQARYVHADDERRVLAMVPITAGIRVR